MAIAKAAFLSDGLTPVTNPLQVGNTFIYRLTITNNGPSAATAVTVSDPLPTGVTPVTPLPGGCAGTTTVTCTLGTITSGATRDPQPERERGRGRREHRPGEHRDRLEHDPRPGHDEQLLERHGRRRNVANLALAKSVSPRTANVGTR